MRIQSSTTRIPKALALCLACAALPPLVDLSSAKLQASGQEQAAEVKSLEQAELGLGPGGALIECCWFAHAWMMENASEKACVVILDEFPGVEACIRRAAVVYSSAGVVKARDFRGPASVLVGVPLSALDKPSSLRPQLLALPSVVSGSAAPDPDRVLPDAVRRIRSRTSAPGFPAVIAGVASTVSSGAGPVEQVTLPWLVCDYGDLHCLFHPSVGYTQVFRIAPVAPSLVPPACVPRGELAEVMLTASSLRKATPGKQVTVVLDPVRMEKSSFGFSTLVREQEGKLLAWNPIAGELQLGKAKGVSLSDTKALGIAVEKRITEMVNDVLRKHNRRINSFGDEIMAGVLGRVVPKSLPGDTHDLQVLRLHQRCELAGVRSVLEQRDSGPVLFIEAEGLSLRYSPERGTYVPKPGEGNTARVRIGPSQASRKVSGGFLSADPKQRAAGVSFTPDATAIAGLEAKASEGNVSALRDLGEILLTGNGVAADAGRAVVLLDKAAAAGDGTAALLLARHLDKTAASEAELSRVLSLYLIAARKGFPEAQYNVGAMTVSARGCKMDRVEGLAWLIVARRNGMTGPGEEDIRAAMARKPERIAEAELRAHAIADEVGAGHGDRPSDVFTPPKPEAPAGFPGKP